MNIPPIQSLPLASSRMRLQMLHYELQKTPPIIRHELHHPFMDVFGWVWLLIGALFLISPIIGLVFKILKSWLI